MFYLQTVSNNKYLLLPTALKEEYNLGVIINLPSLSGLTEVDITNAPATKELELKDINLRKKLNINSRLNLVITDFDRGVRPSRSELQEIFILADEELKDSSEITIDFKKND